MSTAQPAIANHAQTWLKGRSLIREQPTPLQDVPRGNTPSKVYPTLVMCELCANSIVAKADNHWPAGWLPKLDRASVRIVPGLWVVSQFEILGKGRGMP